MSLLLLIPNSQDFSQKRVNIQKQPKHPRNKPYQSPKDFAADHKCQLGDEAHKRKGPLE